MHRIVVARWLKTIMRSEYGDSAVDLVPNSVDRTLFFADVREKRPVPTLGFLYSTASFKGLDVALAAINRVQEKIPSLRLICFGSEHPNYAYALPRGTEFLFSPPQCELRNIYSRCDAWITASRSEGFNLPAMEAMACRTPVISTRTGWPEEAIETGRNGVLVDVDDVEALASGVCWTLSLPSDDWARLSQHAYETTTVGSWEESSLAFEQALYRACRRSMSGEIAGKCECIA